MPNRRAENPRPRRPRDPLQVNLRWLVFLILFWVIIPTVVLTGVGIFVLMEYRGETPGLLMGILVTSFSASVVAGAVLLLVLARRGARLAQVQETFLSRMSHELLTPLAGIRLHTQILEGSRLAPEAQESLAAIRHESARLEELVDRLVGWRKVRAGRHLYQRTPTTLGEIVARVTARVQGSDGAVIRVLDPDLALNVDPEAMAEAVANLLHNALKYAGADGPVELSARRLGRMAVFNVADHGPGLPPGSAAQLFEPFFRYVPAGRPDPGGSGLGLSIARHIVRAHGGKLAVAPRRHGGANFFILLPLGSGQ